VQWLGNLEIAGFPSGDNNEISRNHVVQFWLQVKENFYSKKNWTHYDQIANSKEKEKNNIIRAHFIKGINFKIDSNLEYKNINTIVFLFFYSETW